jgi:WD40 repeat protein
MERCHLFRTLIILVLPAPAGAQPPITALAFSPDGEQIIVGLQLGLEVRRWPSLEVVRELATSLPQVHDAAFSPEGRRLLVGGGAPAAYGGFELFSWPDGELRHERFDHEDVVYAVDWAADGTEFATAAGDELVVTWNANDGTRKRTLVGHSRRVLALAYVPGTDLLVSAGADQSLRLWNRTSGKLVRTLDNHTDIVRDLAARPSRDGLPMIASAGADRTVRFWQPTIGRLVRFARLPAEPLSLAWTADGAQLAVSCTDGHVRVIDPETVEIVSDHALIDGWAYELARARSGRNLAVGGTGGRVVPVETIDAADSRSQPVKIPPDTTEAGTR